MPTSFTNQKWNLYLKKSNNLHKQNAVDINGRRRNSGQLFCFF